MGNTAGTWQRGFLILNILQKNEINKFYFCEDLFFYFEDIMNTGTHSHVLLHFYDLILSSKAF